MSRKAQCFSKSRPPCMQTESSARRCLSKARWPQVRRLRKLSVWQLVVATASAETCTRSKSADVVARLRVRGRADRGVPAVFDQSEGAMKKEEPPPSPIVWRCAQCHACSFAHHLFCGRCGEKKPT